MPYTYGVIVGSRQDALQHMKSIGNTNLMYGGTPLGNTNLMYGGTPIVHTIIVEDDGDDDRVHHATLVEQNRADCSWIVVQVSLAPCVSTHECDQVPGHMYMCQVASHHRVACIKVHAVLYC